ncbi:MAG: nucleoside deaminase [Tissierellia bacterium]|nr:nucleoside deaminase [Tissierellia bacterium]
MKEALRLARKSLETDDIPIGAVIVKDGTIIGRGWNQKEKRKDATMHGEIIAIQEAVKTMNHWWLDGCTMYVTLEPCAMCAGAIVNSRLDKVVIGTRNKRFGACGSAIDILNGPSSNYHIEVEFGLLEEESQLLLKEFFQTLRQKNN